MKHSFINALDLKNNDRYPPIWELEFHLWDKFGKGNFIAGSNFQKLSKAQKEHAVYENAETIARVAELLSFSAVTIPGGYWEVAPGEPAFYYMPDEYRFNQAKIIKEYIGKDVALVANTGGVMAMPEGHEFVEFSIRLMTEPESIDILAREKFETARINIDRFAEIGVDVMLTASDIADGHGLYFSPEQLERYIYPYLKEWGRYIKSKGLRSIIHTDGNINNALGKIADSGINGLQALDSTAKMDIVSIEQEYGDRICVCGNIDCGMMLLSTPETIYETTTLLLNKIGESRSFVLGASNALQYDTPPQNYMAIVEAVRNKKNNVK